MTEIRNRHDAEIRAALLGFLGESEAGDSLLVQEWAIDRAVVDVGLIAPHCIAGFEIKSAADSVTRLASQAMAYGRVFDACTLVTADSHVRHAARTLPTWWGLWVWRGGRIHIERVGGGNIDNNAARLLWSNELSALLAELGLRQRARDEQARMDREMGLHVGCGSKCKRRPTKPAMMAAVSMTSEVRAWVARRLMARPGWRLPDGRSARNYR